ncbi:hypothetical protein Tco_0400093 [Tanacetum coccineum]
MPLAKQEETNMAATSSLACINGYVYSTLINEQQDDQDDDDDRSIDIEKTDDEEETDDGRVHGVEYVHDDVDEEMKDVGVTETRKDKEDYSYAAKADAEKTEEVKDDQVKDDSAQGNQEIVLLLQHRKAPVYQGGPEKQQMPKYSIKSFDEAALDEYDQKSVFFQTMTKSKSFNKHPAHKALYHALIESLLADEEAMDQGVVDLLKQKKRQHDDQDEDPSTGPN